MREHKIREALTEHLHDVGVAVSVASLEEWDAIAPMASPTWRLGFSGPHPFPEPGTPAQPDDPPYVVAIGPDFVDALTDDLDDEDLDCYLDTVTYVADLMIALGREIPDQRERFREIEDRLLDQAPGSLELLDLIELRALDAGSAGAAAAARSLRAEAGPTSPFPPADQASKTPKPLGEANPATRNTKGDVRQHQGQCLHRRPLATCPVCGPGRQPVYITSGGLAFHLNPRCGSLEKGQDIVRARGGIVSPIEVVDPSQQSTELRRRRACRTCVH